MAFAGRAAPPTPPPPPLPGMKKDETLTGKPLTIFRRGEGEVCPMARGELVPAVRAMMPSPARDLASGPPAQGGGIVALLAFVAETQ